MTKFFQATLATLFLLLAASVPAIAATTPPKVVFIGDWVTYYWSSAFAANPTWINQGAQGVYGDGRSAQMLERFQSDVVSLHPAIVHIMMGADDATTTDDATYQSAIPQFLSNLDAMVKEAKAANIQVILGIEPPAFSYNPPLLNSLSAVIANYGAANGIPVINYGDALCVCVGSVSASTLSLVPSTSSFGYPAAGNGPLIIPSPYPALIDGSYFVPSTAGYSVMTQMAETAVSTLNLTLKSGWLSDVEQQDPNLGVNAPTPNVNTVYPHAALQFTPIGKYSDGSDQPLVNSNYQGATGSWTSSNPLVMSVSQTGLATALSPGTAAIQYYSPVGVKFSRWVMYVSAPQE